MTQRVDPVAPTPHDLRCAERTRVLKLAEVGDPPHPPADLLASIAADVQACCGHTPLKAYRLAYGWTVTGAVQALRRTCEEEGLGVSGLTKRSWLEWEAGKRPSRYNQDLLCRLFASGPVRLGFARDYGSEDFPRAPGSAALSLRDTALPVGEPAEPGKRPVTSPTVRWEPTRPCRTPVDGVEWDVVMNAAHESSEHAAAFESASVGPNALEQLGDDIIRIARAYVHTPPLPLLGELVRVRNRTYWLLDRTQHPQQQRDLHVVAGQSCGLLASASFDLGYPHAAAQQARAARAYAEIIGYDELRGWTDGILASIELWAGRPTDALRLAERGLSTVPDGGTAQVRLWCIAARAAALLGDERRTVEAVAASRQVREARRAATELHDGIGGEFGFSAARQAFSNGSAYLKLGRPDDAVVECGHAVELHAQAPAEQRWYAAEAGARADLATAHLLRGDLAGAREVLGGVLTLRPDKRVQGVVQRLGAVRGVLSQPAFHNREGRALVEEIEQFTAETVVQALPAPPA